MAELQQAIVNFFVLLRCLLLIGFYTGLILIPIVLIGHEWWKQRKDVHRD